MAYLVWRSMVSCMRAYVRFGGDLVCWLDFYQSRVSRKTFNGHNSKGNVEAQVLKEDPLRT